MPDPKGRKNRRDRERERRRLREPGVPLPVGEGLDREARQARTRPSAPASVARRPTGLAEQPSVRVRVSGAMIGVLTLLGASYMIIAAVLNGSGADSVVSIGAGVILFAVGLFASVLSLFPMQVRRWVRRND